MYNFKNRGPPMEDPYAYGMEQEEEEEDEYGYDYEYDEEGYGDEYGYEYEDEEEDENGIPSYMQKAEKTGGIGGLGLSKKNSLGGNMQKQQDFSATGGSFYGGKKKEQDEEPYKDPFADSQDDYGAGDYDYNMKGGAGGKQKQPAKKAGGKESKVKGKPGMDVKRFGLKFDPPTLILEYQMPNGKLYHHKMRLTKLSSDTNNADALEYLKKKHASYFYGNQIDDKQVHDLIDKLKRHLHSKKGAIYDTKKKESSGIAAGSTKKATNQKKDDKFDVSQYQNLNLNKLSTQELKKHKDLMEVQFKKNCLKPGDAGYQYEINQDFDPQESNDWDD